MTAPPNSSDDRSRKFGWPALIAAAVIVFVSLLLLPAIRSSRRVPRIPSVQMEISKLEQAIVAFKVTYGSEPPSGLVLHADQASWVQDRRSRGLIRQLWPEFEFTTCGGMKSVPPEGITLNGSECLVFFLGGLSHPGTGELIGFSKNPRRPFSSEEASREGPFFEFHGRYSPNDQRWVGRLTDQNRNGFPEYLDPLPGQTNPYLYASSYSSARYRTEDLGGAMRDVYRTRNGVAYKPFWFQIISPGRDGKYGHGGLYDPELADAILKSERSVERDNLTNFMAGTLAETRTYPIAWLVKVGSVALICAVVFAAKGGRRDKVWFLVFLFLTIGWAAIGMSMSGFRW